jgi:hypothetical protein
LAYVGIKQVQSRSSGHRRKEIDAPPSAAFEMSFKVKEKRWQPHAAQRSKRSKEWSKTEVQGKEGDEK